MEVTENQTVEEGKQIRGALASVLTGQKQEAPAAQPVAAAPAVEPAAPAEVKVEVTPAQVVVETPVVMATPTVDPYDNVVASVVGGQPAVQWSDDAKNLFKTTFGAEDPLAFKAEIDNKLTQVQLFETQLKELQPLKSAFEAMPPAMHVAFQKAMQGDVAGAQEYLKSMPTAALENKAAKDLNDRQLIDTYFPDKMKSEQWAMLNDPEADSDVKEALKTKVTALREAAEFKHEASRNDHQETVAKQKQAQELAFKEYQAAVTNTAALAKGSNLGSFVDDTFVNNLQTGDYIMNFVQKDGVTPTPQAATLLLKALHFDPAVKAAEARGYKRGLEEARLEDTSRMPSAVRSAARDAGDAPKNPTQQDSINQILFRALNTN